jgi:hypothetical protein
VKPTAASAPVGSPLLLDGSGQGAPRSVAFHGQAHRLTDALQPDMVAQIMTMMKSKVAIAEIGAAGTTK